jgi:hypothetical protein
LVELGVALSKYDTILKLNRTPKASGRGIARRTKLLSFKVSNISVHNTTTGYTTKRKRRNATKPNVLNLSVTSSGANLISSGKHTPKKNAKNEVVSVFTIRDNVELITG